MNKDVDEDKIMKIEGVNVVWSEILLKVKVYPIDECGWNVSRCHD